MDCSTLAAGCPTPFAERQDWQWAGTGNAHCLMLAIGTGGCCSFEVDCLDPISDYGSLIKSGISPKLDTLQWPTV